MPNKQRKAEQASKAKGATPKADSASGPSQSTDVKAPGKGKKAAKPDAKPGAETTTVDEAPKKPDTRELVSGTSSWTGKLPMNLLAEHCQKQKWQKPDYGMRKLGEEQFISWVTLKSVNPQSKEVTTLEPFRVPSSIEHLFIQPTPAEARHYAATYALFRFSSGKNIHMMLPPVIRDAWKELLELKKSELADKTAHKAWLYEADPFKAQKEHDQAVASAVKAREIRQRAANAESSGSPSLATLPSRGPWKYAATVDLGMRRRGEVEAVVRKYTKWNAHHIHIPTQQVDGVVQSLTALGFRKKHAEEAVEQCADKEEALEWLLIHVPEDDLPPWSFPEGYTAGINLASSNLARGAAIQRMHEAGYPTDLCAAKFDAHQGDELAAAEDLQSGLVESSTNESAASIVDDTWKEEADTLEATFAERFKVLSKATYQVDTTIDGIMIAVRMSKSKAYPEQPPILALHGKMPAHIKFSIYRRLLKYCYEFLIGQPMVYSIIDWIEENAAAVMADPDRLGDVAGAMFGRSEELDPNLRSTSARASRRGFVPRAAVKGSGAEMSNRLRNIQATAPYQKMLKVRQSLPAWRLQEDIIGTVRNHQVTIVSGETGSGKSTQVVQFILDDIINAELGPSTNIICTQPRRISALGLAARVGDERCSSVGDEVGYSIRGESKQSAKTKITFVTTGVLLRRLQSASSYAEALNGVSHVVVDEVHERDLDTDFLLILLRNILGKRKDLKVLLMSATLDAAIFESYFGAAASVGKINIPGRTYPVTDHYLDDVIEISGFTDASSRDTKETIQRLGFRVNYDLIFATITAICDQLKDQQGGILIFLPGVAEINRVIDGLKRHSEVSAFPLHASLTPAEQRRVFPPLKDGRRKVIAATNVAETSITIDDIVAVIDTGKVKQTSFDPQSNMVKLQEALVSQAAAKQRRGRAGRTRAGDCYKLYTLEAETRMAPRPEPEIVRVPLEQLYLSVRAMGVTDVPSFLQSALTPPTITAIEGARNQLLAIGALEGTNLTALGYHLSRIPADLRLAKLMIYGVLFCCLNRCVTIASILTARSPFVSPQENREAANQARARFADDQGDLIGDLRAYEEWSEKLANGTNSEAKKWCFENFLSDQTLRDISTNRTQYLSSLQEIGFIESSRSREHTQDSLLDANSSNLVLLRAIIAGAFWPQMARIQMPNKKYMETVSGTVEQDPEARTIKYFLKNTDRVFVHPSSTLFAAQSFANGSIFMAYFTKMATAKTFIRDLTPFTKYALLLFGGRIELATKERGLVVDDWLRLRGWPRIGVLVSRLRSILDQILEIRIDNPGTSGQSEQEQEVLNTVIGLLDYDGLDR